MSIAKHWQKSWRGIQELVRWYLWIRKKNKKTLILQNLIWIAIIKVKEQIFEIVFKLDRILQIIIEKRVSILRIWFNNQQSCNNKKKTLANPIILI